MALADLFDDVSARLSGITTHLGEEFISRNEAPPRVIWVPTRDSFAAAQRAVGAAVNYPRPAMTRIAGCDIHIWGKGTGSSDARHLSATEALLNKVIIAIRAEALGSVEFEAADWSTASDNQYGRVCVLRARFMLPVVPATDDDDTTTTTFTDVDPMEGTEVLPSGDITGVPAP